MIFNHWVAQLLLIGAGTVYPIAKTSLCVSRNQDASAWATYWVLYTALHMFFPMMGFASTFLVEIQLTVLICLIGTSDAESTLMIARSFGGQAVAKMEATKSRNLDATPAPAPTEASVANEVGAGGNIDSTFPVWALALMENLENFQDPRYPQQISPACSDRTATTEADSSDEEGPEDNDDAADNLQDDTVHPPSPVGPLELSATMDDLVTDDPPPQSPMVQSPAVDPSVASPGGSSSSRPPASPPPRRSSRRAT